MLCICGFILKTLQGPDPLLSANIVNRIVSSSPTLTYSDAAQIIQEYSDLEIPRIDFSQGKEVNLLAGLKAFLTIIQQLDKNLCIAKSNRDRQ